MPNTTKAILVDGKPVGYMPATDSENISYGSGSVADALDGLTEPSVALYNFSNSKVSSSYNIVCRKVGRVATIRFILRASDTIAINEVLATIGDKYKPIDDVYIITYLAGETLFLKTNGQLVNSNLSTLATGGYRHCQATYITAS